MDERKNIAPGRKELKIDDFVSVGAETIRKSISANPSLKGEDIPDGTYQGTIKTLVGDKAKILFSNIGGAEITYVISISEL